MQDILSPISSPIPFINWQLQVCGFLIIWFIFIDYDKALVLGTTRATELFGGSALPGRYKLVIKSS